MKNGSPILTSKLGLDSVKDLCKLISTCARANVRTLKINDIEIQFGQATPSSVPKIISPVDTRLVEQASQNLVEEEARQTRFDMLQQDVEELKLTDPLAFEQLIGGEYGVETA